MNKQRSPLCAELWQHNYLIYCRPSQIRFSPTMSVALQLSYYETLMDGDVWGGVSKRQEDRNHPGSIHPLLSQRCMEMHEWSGSWVTVRERRAGGTVFIACSSKSFLHRCIPFPNP